MIRRLWSEWEKCNSFVSLIHMKGHDGDNWSQSAILYERSCYYLNEYVDLLSKQARKHIIKGRYLHFRF